MRAEAVGWENDIELSDEEIEDLRRRPVIGIMRRYYGEFDQEKQDRIPIRIRVGRTDKENVIDLHIPPGLEFGEIGAYNLVISEEAYEQLIDKGMTGERLWGSCKIEIYRKGMRRY